MNAIDWPTVETLVASDRITVYRAALSEAIARRDALQQSLLEMMDHIALLRFKLGQAQETLLPDHPLVGRPIRQTESPLPESATTICIE
jgi:hypothetical protein